MTTLPQPLAAVMQEFARLMVAGETLEEVVLGTPACREQYLQHRDRLVAFLSYEVERLSGEALGVRPVDPSLIGLSEETDRYFGICQSGPKNGKLISDRKAMRRELVELYSIDVSHNQREGLRVDSMNPKR